MNTRVFLTPRNDEYESESFLRKDTFVVLATDVGTRQRKIEERSRMPLDFVQPSNDRRIRDMHRSRGNARRTSKRDLLKRVYRVMGRVCLTVERNIAERDEFLRHTDFKI